MGKGRLQQVALGALAGLCLHFLDEVIPDLAEGRLLMAAAVLVAVFFGVALALLGDLRLRAALAGGFLVALPTGALMLLESFGFASAGQFLQAGHGVFAGLILAVFPVPFVMAIGQQGRVGFRHAQPPALIPAPASKVVTFQAPVLKITHIRIGRV